MDMLLVLLTRRATASSAFGVSRSGSCSVMASRVGVEPQSAIVRNNRFANRCLCPARQVTAGGHDGQIRPEDRARVRAM
jgi:hypothetical protein